MENNHKLHYYIDGVRAKEYSVFCDTAGFVIAAQMKGRRVTVVAEPIGLIVWSSDVDSDYVSQDYATKAIAGRYYQATGQFFDNPSAEMAIKYVKEKQND